MTMMAPEVPMAKIGFAFRTIALKLVSLLIFSDTESSDVTLTRIKVDSST